MYSTYVPRALTVGLLAVAVPVLLLLLGGVATGHQKQPYELIKELFVPLVGPLIAVLIPLLLFFVIPSGQNRQRTALELCQQYFSEEMREARNTAWRHFVLDPRRKALVDRPQRMIEFLNYLINPETHAEIDPIHDEVFQKTARVLDFFALVNEYVARGMADSSLVRSFLLYYYLWWRDEILEPLRRVRKIETDDPKLKPYWWDSLSHLDHLAKPHPSSKPMIGAESP